MMCQAILWFRVKDKNIPTAGNMCTRKHGHDGRHEDAHPLTGQIRATWDPYPASNIRDLDK